MSQAQQEKDEQSFLAHEIYVKIVIAAREPLNSLDLSEDELAFLRWCMNIKQQ